MIWEDNAPLSRWINMVGGSTDMEVKPGYVRVYSGAQPRTPFSAPTGVLLMEYPVTEDLAEWLTLRRLENMLHDLDHAMSKL